MSATFDQTFQNDPTLNKLTTDIYKTGRKIDRLTNSKKYMDEYVNESKTHAAEIEKKAKAAWDTNAGLDPDSRKKLVREVIAAETKYAQGLLDAKYPGREEAFKTQTVLSSLKSDAPKRRAPRKTRSGTKAKPKTKAKSKSKKAK